MQQVKCTPLRSNQKETCFSLVIDCNPFKPASAWSYRGTQKVENYFLHCIVFLESNETVSKIQKYISFIFQQYLDNMHLSLKIRIIIIKVPNIQIMLIMYKFKNLHVVHKKFTLYGVLCQDTENISSSV